MRLNHAALRTIRERTGYSQTDLARMAEIDRPNYAHMEAGRRAGTPQQIRKLALALQVPVAALLGPDVEDAA